MSRATSRPRVLVTAVSWATLVAGSTRGIRGIASRRTAAAMLGLLLVALTTIATAARADARAVAAPQATAPVSLSTQAQAHTQAQNQAPAQAPADVSGPQALFDEAKRLFDALDYEQALVRLDVLVAQLQARRAGPAAPSAQGTAGGAAGADAAANAAAAQLRLLVDALELRARAHFGVGQPERAREDFHALLALRADYAPGETVSPRVIAFFKTLRAGLIGQVRLTIEPADALAYIDGIPTGPFGQPLDIVSGPHVLGIVRTGYRTETRDFIVTAGALSDLTVSMTRASAIVAVVTRPAGVEVKVDGVVRGTTAPAAAGGAEAESAPLSVGDLGVGSHRVELSRPCHEPAAETMVIEQLGDFRLGPIVLRPAVGTIRVGSGIAADIYLDGERRGGAPQTIERVCAGEHLIEARTGSGRDLRRVAVKTGQQLDITLAPRPALALLGNAGLLSGAPEDVRARVERALAPAARLFVFSPPLAEVRRVESAERAPAGWLAVGPGGVPGAGGEWASASAAAARRDLSARLAKALGAQGVVAISRAPERPGMVWLSILAAGAAEPDVIPLDIERPAPALQTLDDVPLSDSALLRRTLGLSLVDVLDRPGPVVVGGEPAGPLAPGTALVALNGQAVARVQDVRRVLDAMGSAATVSAQTQSRAGARDTVELPLIVLPRVLSSVPLHDPAGPASAAASSGASSTSRSPSAGPAALSNVFLLDLRARLSEAVGLEASAMRLNAAAALTRVGDPAGALAMLDELPATGPSAATVQAQRALALASLGRTAAAERAWQAALAASPASSALDERPSIRELAERALRTPAANRPPE